MRLPSRPGRRSPWRALGLLPLLGAAGVWAGERITVRFAPPPTEDRQVIREQFDGLVSYLEEATGLRLEWAFYDDYVDIVGGFKSGDVDLAYIGPLPLVILKREHPAAESLGCFRDEDGDATYTCSLFVAGDSTLTLEGLKGVRIGLTQPYSTCGYLAVSAILRRAGLALDGAGNTYRYAGNHTAAALGLARGEFDVVGVKTTVGTRYRHLDLTVIATSEPYPGFALVANTATLDGATVTALRRAALGLDPVGDPSARERTRGWVAPLRNGILPPEGCDYSGVASALAGVPWPIPGASR